MMDNFYFLINDLFGLLATKKIRKTKQSCLKMIVLEEDSFGGRSFYKIKNEEVVF